MCLRPVPEQTSSSSRPFPRPNIRKPKRRTRNSWPSSPRRRAQPSLCQPSSRSTMSTTSRSVCLSVLSSVNTLSVAADLQHVATRMAHSPGLYQDSWIVSVHQHVHLWNQQAVSARVDSTQRGWVRRHEKAERRGWRNGTEEFMDCRLNAQSDCQQNATEAVLSSKEQHGRGMQLDGQTQVLRIFSCESHIHSLRGAFESSACFSTTRRWPHYWPRSETSRESFEAASPNTRLLSQSNCGIWLTRGLQCGWAGHNDWAVWSSGSAFATLSLYTRELSMMNTSYPCLHQIDENQLW